MTVNDLKSALREKANAAGLEQSAAVVDAVAMATMRFIQRRKKRYCRESNDTPSMNAFCWVAPGVRFRDLAIFATGVF